MSPRSRQKNKGFTLIEVLVAILIFVISALAFIAITRGASRATRDTREVSIATWLLQNTMTEIETKMETEGFDKGCDKKKEGKFAAPYDNYRWVSFCTEIDFKISQTATDAADSEKSDSDNEPKKEDILIKTVLNAASTYVTKSMRELHVEVHWTSGKNKKQIDATTHIARYDQPVQLPTPSVGGS